LLSLHRHALAANDLAGSLMSHAIHGGTAFKADAHAAQRRAWLSSF
jgi:hypothetical protein